MEGAINLMTGKIVGAEQGTLSWFHEEGHKIYNDSEQGIRNRLKQGYIFDFMIATLIGAFFWRYFAILSGILFIIYKGYDLYEERWANKYAKDKFINLKNLNKLDIKNEAKKEF